MTDYATPFLARLGAPRTADMLAAVGVWQRQESGGSVLGNNAWNLHAGPACPTNAGAAVAGLQPSQRLRSGSIPGLIGNRWAGPGDTNVAIFDTPANGAGAAASNLLAWNAYGYPAVVFAARKGDALGFLDALAASSWSAGRYGTANGGPNALIEAYRRIVRPLTTGAPPPVTGGPHMLTVKTTSPLAAGMEGTIGPDTRRWALDGTKLDPIGPSTLGLVSLDLLSGDINGHFWRTATTPNVYVAYPSLTLVDPAGPVVASATPAPATTASFSGAFAPGYLRAIGIPQDAGSEANLTVNEYAVLVTGQQLALDWLGEARGWMAANLGSPSYLSQLFNRLGLLVNSIQRPDLNGLPAILNGGAIVGQSVLPAIAATQAEIDRVELLGRETGTGDPTRSLDPAVFLPALVRGEGVFVMGSPEVRAALVAAGIGAAPIATNEWQVQRAAAAAAGVLVADQ